MNDRDTRRAALEAAVATAGDAGVSTVLKRAQEYYEWLVQPTPLPPPAFGFVAAAAQATIPNAPEYRSDLLSIDEACEMMGLSEPTMRRNAASDPKFPQKIKISKRRVAYRREDIERYLTEQST